MRARQIARSLLHSLLELHVGIEQLLFFLGHLTTALFVAVALTEGPPHLLFEFLLASGKLFGLAREIRDVVAVLLPLHGLQHLLRLLEPLGSALGIRLSLRGTLALLLAGLPRGSRIRHIARGLLERADRLLQLVVAGLLRPSTVHAVARHASRLLLSLLPALLARLSLLT